MCNRHEIKISAIERLQDGGTRVVLMNGDNTAIIAHAFKASISTGVARRFPVFSQQR